MAAKIDILAPCFLLLCLSFYSSTEATVILPEVRLSDGPTPNAGRVEVYMDGNWGTVCNHNIDANAAGMFCSWLGLGYGGVVMGSDYGEGSGPIWLDSVSCPYGAKDLYECHGYTWDDNTCSHSQDLSILCGAISEFSAPGINAVRLNNSDIYSYYNSYGALEVLYDGEWGAACLGTFGKSEADAFCQALGFGEGDVQSYWDRSSYNYEPSRIWIDSFYCSFEEEELNGLAGCSYQDPYTARNCTQTEVVHLNCYEKDDGYSYHHYSHELVALNMEMGEDYLMGSPHVKYDGTYGHICRSVPGTPSPYNSDPDDEFTAKVMCKDFGYKNGELLQGTYPAVGPMLLHNVNCYESADELNDCGFSMINMRVSAFDPPSNCTERFAIKCYEKDDGGRAASTALIVCVSLIAVCTIVGGVLCCRFCCKESRRPTTLQAGPNAPSQRTPMMSATTTAQNNPNPPVQPDRSNQGENDFVVLPPAPNNHLPPIESNPPPPPSYQVLYVPEGQTEAQQSSGPAN